MLNIKKFKSEIQKYDVERPNLFTTYIYMPRNMPQYLQDYMSGLADPLRLFAQSVNLPGVQLTTNPVKRYGVGPNQLMPTGVEFGNTVTVTYISDAQAKLLALFYGWISTINPAFNKIPAAGVTSTDRSGNETLNPSFIHSYQDTYMSEMHITTYKGVPGKFGGSGLTQTFVSTAASAAGLPFIGSLLGGLSGPEYDLEPLRQIKLHKAYPIAITENSLSASSTDTFSTFNVTFAYYNWELSLFNSTFTEAEEDSGFF